MSVKVKSPLQRIISMLLCVAMLMSFAVPVWATETSETTTQNADAGTSGMSDDVEYVSLPITIRDFAADGMLFEFNQINQSSTTYAPWKTYDFQTGSLSADYSWSSNDNLGFRIRTYEVHGTELPYSYDWWYCVICESDGSIKKVLPAGTGSKTEYATYMTTGCYSVWLWIADGSSEACKAQYQMYKEFEELVNEETQHRYHITYTTDGTLTVGVEVKELNGKKYIVGDNNGFTLQRTDESDYVNNLTTNDSIPGTSLISNTTSGSTPPDPVEVTLNSGALQYVYGANLRTDLVTATLDANKNPVYTQDTVDYLADLLATLLQVPYTIKLGGETYYTGYYILGTKLYGSNNEYVGAGDASATKDLADVFRACINGGMGTYAAAKARFEAGSLSVPKDVDTYYEAAYYLLHSLWQDNATESYIGNDGYGWNTWNYDKINLVQTTNANGEKCYVFNSGYDDTEYDPMGVVDGQYTGSGAIYNTQVETITAARNPGTNGYNGSTVYSNGVVLPNTRFDPLGTSGAGQIFGYGQDAGTYCTLTGVYPDRGEIFYPETNYHLSLEGHAKFIYYKDANQYFTFTGDDDVYLYINGKRVLDLGGAHSIAMVKINLNDVAEMCGLSDGMTYDFDFYYTERHGTAANFGIETNIQIVDPSMLTTKTGYQNGETTGYNGYVNPDIPMTYEFALSNNGESAVQNLTFYDPTIGISLTKDAISLNKLTTMDDLSVMLYGSDGNVKSSVAAGSLTEDVLKQYLTNGLQVGEKIVIHGFSYKILNEDWERRLQSDGITYSNWYFFNIIYTTATAVGENSSTRELTGTSNWVVQKQQDEKLGNLTISKQLDEDASATLLDKIFTMQVLMDGKPIPVGTAYAYTPENGTKEYRMVEKAGQIPLEVGATASLRAVYGTTFQVSELIAEEDRDVYRATYEATNATAADNGVTGTFTENADATVTVINHTIPGGLVETDKYVTATDDPNKFTLTLESFVEGELTNVATTTPADFVLVLDQSASMYTPAGSAKGYDNTSLVEPTTLTSYVEIAELDSTKAQHMGYYIAQSKSGRGDYHDWFVVQYINSKWYYVRLDGTSTPADLDVAGASSEYGTGAIGETLVRTEPFANFNHYQTGYGALYDSVTRFVDGLKDTGVDHRVAVVGFAAPFYDAMEHFDGSGVYVNGEYYLYDTEYLKDSGGTYSYIYKEGVGSKYYLNGDQVAALPTVGAETVYDQALVSVKDNYNSVLNSLNAVTTNYWHTCPAAGLDMANHILEETPANGRNRTVLLFTDGVPTIRIGANYENAHNYEDTNEEGLSLAHVYWTVAQGKDNALEMAYETKNTYGANIHTIGTAGADADTLFLQGVSSDYPNAQSYPTYYMNGENKKAPFEDDGDRQPTQEEKEAMLGDPIANPMFSHFVTEDISLDDIFEEILQTTTNLNLGADAVLKEVLTDYFELNSGEVSMEALKNNPEIAVKVYTALYDGKGNFGDRTELTDAKVTLSSSDGSDRLDTIEVTGYDYAAEFVSDEPRQKSNADGTVINPYYGSKLIVEVQIETRDGFWGGNNVPTNEDTTAIYEKTGDLVDKFPEPQVNVPLSLTLESDDAVVYYGSDVLDDGLLTELKAGGLDVVINDDGTLSPQADWMDDFATLIWTGNVAPKAALSTTEPDEYTYSAKLVPNTDGTTNTCTYPSNIAGDQVPLSGVTAADNSTVDVLVPVIPFKDSTITKGETPDESYFNSINLVDENIRWVLIDDIEITAAATHGTAPDLQFTYTYPDEFTEATPVEVTVQAQYGETAAMEFTNVSYFDWVVCQSGLHDEGTIAFHTGSTADQNEFWIHVGDATDSGLVTDKYVTATEDANAFELTLEAYALGEQKSITVTKPADIVLVLDHSGSMRTPVGATEVLKSGTLYNGSGEIPRSQLSTQKAQHRGYYVAQSKETKNWFIMEYDPAFNLEDGTTAARWVGYLVPSTESIVDTTEGNYTEHEKTQSWVPGSVDANLIFYKSQYAVLYDAMLEFVQDLKETGAEHNVAIVGFAGSEGYGTRLYVGSEGSGNSGFKYYRDHLYHTNTTQERRDELYQMALKNVQDATEYAQLLSNIELIETNHSFTCPTAGLQLANEVFEANDVDLAERDRIVVLFTDGIPNCKMGEKKIPENADEDATRQDAIYDEIVRKAYESKVTYGVKLYSICTTTVTGSRDFLNYSSSNYPDADTYTTPGTNVSEKYFHEIDGLDKLNSAFSTITQSTTSTSTTLDKTAILREVLTDYFVLNPDDEVDVEIYTAAYNGDGTFADPVLRTEAEGFEYVLSSSDGTERMDTIDVTGFDYHDEYISNVARTDADGNPYYGSKLMVKVRVYTRDGFWGGNNVPTNDEATAIYTPESAGPDGEIIPSQPVQNFPEPEVNVPITVDVVAKDKTIYYGGELDSDKDGEEGDELIEKVTIGGKEVTVNNDGTFTPQDSWMDDFADASWTEDSTKPESDLSNIDPEDYTYTVTVTPKYDGEKNQSENPSNIAGNIDGGDIRDEDLAVPENGVSDSDTGHVYILVPEITFKDSVAEFGASTDGYDYETNDYVKTEWVNMETDLPEGTVIPDPDETTKPELTLTYTPESDVFTGDTKVEVAITSSNPDGDITSVTEFKWENCTHELHGNCGTIEPHKPNDAGKHEFWIHVTLEIVPDTVVIDFGLPVDVDPLTNDLYGDENVTKTLVGIGDVSGATYTGTFGTAAINEGNTTVRYTLNTSNGMQMNTEETFAYQGSYSVGNKSMTAESTITVIPATIIYYEDNFLDYVTYNADCTLANNVWNLTAEASTVVQDTDRPGVDQIGMDMDNIYGYDSHYTGEDLYSMDSAHQITVDENIFGEAVFTFTGTGFDVIALSSNTTGTITVDIYSTDFNNKVDGIYNHSATLYRSYMVDTYYGYTYGDDPSTEEVKDVWYVVDPQSPNALYQVPVMKVDLSEAIDGHAALPYGTYTAVITVAYNKAFDHEQYDEGGKYDFMLDAIRIYDQANDGAGSQVIKDAYVADGEGWPSYTELRNILIDANTFDSLGAEDEVNGVIFIDGIPNLTNDSASNEEGDVSDNITNKTPAITDYANFGPNNELYLAPGQAVSFQLSAPAIARNVHLALKSVGGTGKVLVYGIDANGTKAYAMGAADESKSIATATDLYYDITALNGKTVVIANAGGTSDAILSITNIKTTYQSNPNGAATTSFKMSRPAADLAVASLTAEETTEPEIPEETIPETTVPEETIPETTVPEETVPETTVPEVTEPEEPETFEPEKFKVKLSDSSVKVGSKVTVTVTTSDDVEYITVNGAVVTDYTTSRRSDDRTWKVKVTAEAAGKMDIDVICYNAANVASAPVSKTLTVTQQYTSIGSWLKDLIGAIIGGWR